MTENTPQQTKFQNTEYLELKRSEIKNAPYNPRKITDHALIQLKKNFKKVGMLGGIVVNKRTMNIVSGHQRLKALDQLEKSEDYLIRVEIIDVDEKTEREQNIFMNSHSVQGEFDLDLMRDMVKGIDYASAGLTEMDMCLIGVETGIDDLTQTFEKELADIGMSAEKKQKIKETKKKIRQNIDDRFEEGDPLLVLSFDSFAAKAQFMERFDLDRYEKFIKGEAFAEMVERI